MHYSKTRPKLSADRLEDRLTPTYLSASEQYFLELVNRARANPTGEAARFGIDLNEGLAPGTISSSPVQPLAPSDALKNSIDGQLAYLSSIGQLSHTGSGGSTVASRISAAGYSWTSAGENLAVSSGISNDANGADVLNQLLFVDAGYAGRGHRINMLRSNYQEVGVGLTGGNFQGFNAIYNGEDFGSQGTRPFITGVAYTDGVSADHFYTPGEGIGNVTVTATGSGGTFTTSTSPAGGYSLQLPTGSYTVTFRTSDGKTSTSSVSVGSTNIKVDYVPAYAVSPPPISPPPVSPISPPPVTTPPTVPPTSATLNVGSGRLFAVGADAGGSTSVNMIDGLSGQVTTQISTPATYGSGARVSTADFNGDGVLDTVIATGPGVTAEVRIVDGKTQQNLFDIMPFGSFDGGVYVATGDISGDGKPDLVITADQGGGPRVRVFNGNGFTQIADFFGINDPNFRGGCRPAVGDINGDGFADLIVSAGVGGGPRVSVYDGRRLGPNGGPNLFGDFFAFEQSLRNGAYVTAGDINGDGKADLIVGAGPGGGPRVTIFSGSNLMNNQQSVLADFFAGDPSNRGGVRVAAADVDGDGKADVIVGSGPTNQGGGGSRVSVYLGRNLAINNATSQFTIDAFSGFDGGVFVG